MTTITKFINTLINKAKNLVDKISETKKKLSLAEKVLIGLAYAVVALCVVFPTIFWIATAVGIIFLLIDHKREKKETETSETSTEIIDTKPVDIA